MISIIDMIPAFNGLYELAKAIDNEIPCIRSHYGDLKSFKEWIKKIRKLGIQPAVIPDNYGIDEIPSIYDLLKENIKENEHE